MPLLGIDNEDLDDHEESRPVPVRPSRSSRRCVKLTRHCSLQVIVSPSPLLLHLSFYHHNNTTSVSKRALDEASLKEAVDHIQIGNEEHTSKWMKEKDKEEGRSVTSRIIAVEGTEHKTSLKDIPGEIMDRIFGVRPELEVCSTGIEAC